MQLVHEGMGIPPQFHHDGVHSPPFVTRVSPPPTLS
jgi:hypothetical protein